MYKFQYLIFLFLLNAEIASACIEADDTNAILEGIFTSEILTGQPNYERNETGDEKQVIWFVILDKPVCFVDVGNLEKIQLVLTNTTENNNLMAQGQRYQFEGKVFLRNSKDQITEVLLEVYKINAL